MKKQVGVEIGSYSFNKTAKTITFKDCGQLTLDNILLITNVTDHLIIYNFADPATTGTMVNNVLTLTYDTSSMSDTDNLQIFINVDDSADTFMMFNQLMNAIQNPVFLELALNRARTSAIIESGTVTTVTTLTGVTNLGNYPADRLLEALNTLQYQNYVNHVTTT